MPTDLFVEVNAARLVFHKIFSFQYLSFAALRHFSLCSRRKTRRDRRAAVRLEFVKAPIGRRSYANRVYGPAVGTALRVSLEAISSRRPAVIELAARLVHPVSFGGMAFRPDPSSRLT